MSEPTDLDMLWLVAFEAITPTAREDSLQRLVAAIRADERERIIAAVEALIAQAGGRCVRPDDYDPGEINICETHSEILYAEGCEDHPRHLIAVLAAIRGEP